MKATDVKNHSAIGWLMVLLILHIGSWKAMAQYPKIDDDIAKHRKGELIVKAKPGDKVTIEQLSHEFWFGCAISNGFVDGTMSPQDVKQYEEKFLKHFNSAVTENAVKWLSMERERGKVNYAAVDGILAWTEKHNIPLRGHNLFWGISQFCPALAKGNE
jgi:GH35 family endo-1,4-beta-xylanase